MIVQSNQKEKRKETVFLDSVRKQLRGGLRSSEILACMATAWEKSFESDSEIDEEERRRKKAEESKKKKPNEK